MEDRIKIEQIKKINIFLFILSLICLIFSFDAIGLITIFFLLSMWSIIPALITLYLAPLEFLTIFQFAITILFGPFVGGVFGAFTQAYTRTLGTFIYVPALIKLAITRFLVAFIFYFLYVTLELSFFVSIILFFILFYVIYIILTIIIDKEELSFEVYLIITFIPGQISSVLIFTYLHDTILRRYFEGELIYDLKTFVFSYIIIGILFGITYLSSRKKIIQRKGIVSTILSVLIFTIKKILLFEKIESKANTMKERLKNKNININIYFHQIKRLKIYFMVH